MNTNYNIWQRKLLAFLHDPPEKAYDFSIEHEKRADVHAKAFGLSEDILPSKHADWFASAADRFVFPQASACAVRNMRFFHPFGGTRLEGFPAEDVTSRMISNAIPSYENADDEARFWLAWRCWMQQVANQSGGDRLPYLPADTRIPDGSIWLHNAVSAALEATRAGDDRAARLEPAFLLFQLGPVQEFIAQARSTRDLWSGSYLISWLMLHAIQAVAKECGPDAVIFPSVRGLPAYDWMNQAFLKQAKFRVGANESESFWKAHRMDEGVFQDAVLTPNLPNRFLAVVSRRFDPTKAEAALRAEWQSICQACRGALDTDAHSFGAKGRRFWDHQVANCWQTTWQLLPWTEAKEALELLAALPNCQRHPLQRSCDIARAIPASDRVAYYYGADGYPSCAWAWSAHYQLVQHRLDARRQTRDFAAWQASAETSQHPKDALSGREEAVATGTWLAQVRRDRNLAHLFRADDHLGAANLVKRVWHKVYLAGKKDLRRARESFDSVPAVAAAPWKARVLEKMASQKGAEVWMALQALRKAVGSCAEALDFEPPAEEIKETLWVNKVDASVFTAAYWERLEKNAGTNTDLAASLRKANEALDMLLSAAGGRPASYYAVLAMDGDRMGEWVSGERVPPVKELLAPEAVDYFAKRIPADKNVQEWLNAPRPVFPSYHLQFSEALSNFALFAARRIVEAHYGQLIYAGGDDVLAMLPADEAVACAQHLRMAFRGDPTLCKEPGLDQLFTEAPAGFIRLKEGDWNCGARRAFEPSWPLLMPGPRATVSVGMAVGHIREPLQDVIEAAQVEEKRAKGEPAKGGYGRDALAVRLFKRSGEQIEWGSKFESKAFPLLSLLAAYYRTPVDDPKREMPVSRKFPYRVAELLRPLDSKNDVSESTKAVAIREMQWAISRLEMNKVLKEEKERLRRALNEAAEAYLNELQGRRPLSDFYNLFAVEAFIARQGEE